MSPGFEILAKTRPWRGIADKSILNYTLQNKNHWAGIHTAQIIMK